MSDEDRYSREICRARGFTTAAISVSLFLFSLSVISSQHYEPTTVSIVEGFTLGWILFFSSVGIAGYVTIFRFQHFGTLEKIGVTLYGVGSLAFVTAFPYLTGYYMVGRSDTMAHLGWIRDILQFETITSSLIYPVFHILSASSSLVVGVNPRWSMVVTIFATVIGASTAMIAIMNRLVDRAKSPFVIWGFVILVLLALPFRTYHISYYPAGLSTLYLPIMILAVYHTVERRSRLVATVVFIFVALTHPLGLIHVLLLLGVVGITVLNMNQLSPPTWVNAQSVIPATLVVLVFGFLWYDHVGTFGHVIGNAYTSLFIDTGTQDNVEHTSSTLLDIPIVEFILLRYSPHVYLLSATALLPLFLYSQKRSLQEFVPLYAWGVLSLVIGIMAFFATSLIGPLRFLDAAPAVWVSIFALLYLGINKDIKLLSDTPATHLIFVLLLFSLPITLITGVPTPLTYQPSWEVSHEDTATAEWWMDHGDRQYVESLGLNGRVSYSAMSFAERRDYNPDGDFRTYRGRADIFNRSKLAIQKVEIGNKSSLSVLSQNQLIIITDWHTSHANNERLTESRDITGIHEQYNTRGVSWLEQETNKVYTDDSNSALSVNK